MSAKVRISPNEAKTLIAIGCHCAISPQTAAYSTKISAGAAGGLRRKGLVEKVPGLDPGGSQRMRYYLTAAGGSAFVDLLDKLGPTL